MLTENYTIIKCTVWWLFTKQTPKWRPRILSEFQKSPFDTSQSLVTTLCPRQTLLQLLPSLMTFVLFQKQKTSSNWNYTIYILFLKSGFFCSAICFWGSFMCLWVVKLPLFSMLHSMHSTIWLSHNLFFFILLSMIFGLFPVQGYLRDAMSITVLCIVQ